MISENNALLNVLFGFFFSTFIYINELIFSQLVRTVFVLVKLIHAYSLFALEKACFLDIIVNQ